MLPRVDHVLLMQHFADEAAVMPMALDRNLFFRWGHMHLCVLSQCNLHGALREGGEAGAGPVWCGHQGST